MRKLLSTTLLLLAVTAMARGHFVFIVPQEGTRKAQVVFSDELKPDKAELLAKIAHTTYQVSDARGELHRIEASKSDTAFEIQPPGDGPVYVLGHCPYGVLDKGKQPFLLNYQARAIVGLKPGAELPKAPAQNEGLVIVPVAAKDGQAVKVLWQGKPLVEAEVVLLVPGQEDTVTKKSDDRGMVTLPPAGKAGQYGVRARHIEEKSGELKGKKYGSIRTYATLVFPVQASRKSAARETESTVAVRFEEKVKEQPEASRLLAEARAARANWEKFPGFTAAVAVNVDGEVARGKVKVSGKGKVELDLEGPARMWAQRTLASVVGHRLDGSASLSTPCAFADEVADHPMGRKIRVLNDEHHSSYRIRDRQIIEVHRHMGDVRFTITVLENRLNAEKKYLPASYVVNNWDAKSGALRSSLAHHQQWTRVGPFDLPSTVTVVTAEANKQVTRKIELSGHALVEK